MTKLKPSVSLGNFFHFFAGDKKFADILEVLANKVGKWRIKLNTQITKIDSSTNAKSVALFSENNLLGKENNYEPYVCVYCV